jgi:diadenylate cyclase
MDIINNLNFQEIYAKLSFWEILDIILVILLLIQLYRTLRGTIAVSIFTGLLGIYILYNLIKLVEMPLLTEILNRIISIGMIGLIVVFQPEIRRFLINIGKNSPFSKNGLLSKFLQSSSLKKYVIEEESIENISRSIKYFLENKIGALLVICKSNNVDFDSNTGVMINGEVSSRLLESIFERNSPLHDGAVIIDKNSIIAARIVLPITEATSLPSRVGLRHRAAVGASEHSDVLVVIISEEKNNISYAEDGKLFTDVSLDQLKKKMYEAMIYN